ncbi:MAG TPA: biopolymer transporter ExbD [Lacipirellulaceae bacterium]|nr:biopolymer transporter ExbD [Lacipirellulaceae bacterium]
MLGDSFALGPLESDAIVGRQPHREPPEFDITAMVDLVFMMNIYFMVTFITLALAEINLPQATHCQPLDGDDAVVFTVLGTLDGRDVLVSTGAGDETRQLPGGETLTDEIAAAAQQGASAGKKAILIKAEKRVRLRDLFRVAAAADVEGLRLHVAVTERDSP